MPKQSEKLAVFVAEARRIIQRVEAVTLPDDGPFAIDANLLTRNLSTAIDAFRAGTGSAARVAACAYLCETLS